jgi:hypothetical protein
MPAAERAWLVCLFLFPKKSNCACSQRCGTGCNFATSYSSVNDTSVGTDVGEKTSSHLGFPYKESLRSFLATQDKTQLWRQLLFHGGTSICKRNPNTFTKKGKKNVLIEILQILIFLKGGKHLLLNFIPKHKKSQRRNVLVIHQKTDRFSSCYF